MDWVVVLPPVLYWEQATALAWSYCARASMADGR